MAGPASAAGAGGALGTKQLALFACIVAVFVLSWMLLTSQNGGVKRLPRAHAPLDLDHDHGHGHGGFGGAVDVGVDVDGTEHPILVDGDELRAVVIGDWGIGGGRGGAEDHNQYGVAEQLASTAKSFKPQLVLSTGDNMYVGKVVPLRSM